ncbi:MAG: hypothetical protein ACHBN1_04855 [Heteroscytonema crispum UTEX LB 1556]
MAVSDRITILTQYYGCLLPSAMIAPLIVGKAVRGKGSPRLGANRKTDQRNRVSSGLSVEILILHLKKPGF